jgi:DNA-directed RNA polymerase subunit L
MSNTNVFYKVEIDTKDAVQPIIYFRTAKRCKTAKGMERQHNRIVNETVEAWRQFEGQIRLYTVSRVPSDVVVGGEIRNA